MAKTKQKLNPNFTFLEEKVPEQRWTLLQGGTRSGKTFAALQYIVKILVNSPNRGLEVDIVRDTFKALKATAWKDMETILSDLGLYEVKNHNKSDHIYKLNGNFINYYGADDPDKIHGRSRDILYINEVNQIDKETIDQFTPRTRLRIIGDYNPAIVDDHWLDEYIKKYPPLITTYRDNPYLNADQVLDIESKKHQPYWWTVYGTGHRAKREGVIFPNYEVGAFDTSLPFYYGLDFGYTTDPDACVKVAIDEKRNILYLHEIFYEYGDSVDEISKLVKELESAPIVADSAEGRLIDHLATKAGRGIVKVKKGAGSVLHGIRLMENYKMVVTSSSHNLKKELNNYAWAEKGKQAPIDDFNHLIDGVRYVVNTYSNRVVQQPAKSQSKSAKFTRGEFSGGADVPW